MESLSRARHRSFGRRLGVTAVAVLGLSLVPAVVAGSAVAAQPAAAVPDEAPDEGSASVAAKQGNKPVLVQSKTDETTEVRANPNGTFTWKQHVRPVRVNHDGRWIPVDTTLVRHADGRIRPAATMVELELSGGGAAAARAPLVRVAKDGAEVGLGWAGDLPEPILSGATATYPEVLPGVDLVVTADVLGFSEVLVIKTPAAASDPRLKKITFDSHAKGLTVASKAGALTAGNPSATVVFTGDASQMWDSSARRATMGVEATSGALAIVPDQAFLADPNTRYPVYLDPSYRCQTCWKVSHAVVQSAFPTAENYNQTGGKLGDLKAGWVCETEANGGCPRISRSYFHMNTSGLAGKYIFGAYLHAVVINSYYCDGAATPTQLWWTGGIHQHTTWANQPGWIQYLSSNNRTNNPGHCASDGGMDLDAGPAVIEAARLGAPETGFMLKGEDESGNSSWRRFDLNPYLVVDYNSWPNPPADMGMEGFGPNAGDAIPCVTGATRPFLPTRTPRLRARISDPDGGIMDAQFHILQGIPPNHTWDGNKTYVSGIPSGSFAEVTAPANAMPVDGLYSWNLWAGDGHIATWSGVCEFQLDTRLPGDPAITSDLYPANRSAGGVGRTGAFTFAATGADQDTAYYEYGFTTTGGNPQLRLTPSTLNGLVTLQWTPTLSGPQTLSVRAVDRAGNRSGIVRYNVVVSDHQVGISGKVASWSLENSPRDGSGVKSLAYDGPPFGPRYGSGHDGSGVLIDPANTEFYRAKDALIRTDTSFTVSAWVNLERTGTHAVIASQDGDRLSGFYFQYHPDPDRWALVMSDRDSENGTGWYSVIATAPPAVGVWTHLAGVFDASAKKLRLYVDGQLDAEAGAPPAPWNAAGPFIIGAGKGSGQRIQHFAGAIDSVRVHARALSSAEVAALKAGTDPANPAAEYQFENNLDNTGATNDLVQPATGMSYVDGYAGKGIRFASSTGPGMAGTAPVINTTGSYSVAAWVKLDDKAGYYHIAGQDGNRASGFLLRYSTDVDRWIFGVPRQDIDADTVQWAIGTSVPEAGVWTHIAAVHDAGTHKISLYVNGKLEAQRDLVATIDAGGPFVVGCTKWFGARTGQFKGSIDEVNVYDGVLQPAEVATLANVPVERARYALNETTGVVAHDSVGGAQADLYGTGITWGQHYGQASAAFPGSSTEQAGTIAGPGPVARWDLDNRLTDASGNGRNLFHVNNSGPTAATYTGGRINEGVKLNGTDQRMQTSGAVVDTSRSYSVSAWIRLDRDDGWFTIAGQDGTVASPFHLQYSDDIDRWTFSMVSADQLTNVTTIRSPSKLPPLLGQWTHLLGVYDATGTRARLYVNGHLEGDVPATTAWRSTGSFSVGRGKWGGAMDPFAGTIDEVRVYDRALTATDANGLWNLGSDIAVPRPAAFRADQSFVVAAFARPAGYDATARTVLATDGDRYSPMLISYRPEWRRWSVAMSTGSETQPVVRWVLSDNEAGTYADPNGWVHLAAVYDAPARQVRLYVNGVRQRTIPGAAPNTVVQSDQAGADVTMRDSGRGLLIGRVTYVGGAVGHWNGAIRDVRIFSGVLPENCGTDAPNCLSQLPTQ